MTCPHCKEKTKINENEIQTVRMIAGHFLDDGERERHELERMMLRWLEDHLILKDKRIEELEERCKVFHEEISELLEKLKQFEWRPIESAPRDFSNVLVIDEDFQDQPFTAFYSKDDSVTRDGWYVLLTQRRVYPTHWLPTPPKEDE